MSKIGEEFDPEIHYFYDYNGLQFDTLDEISIALPLPDFITYVCNLQELRPADEEEAFEMCIIGLINNADDKGVVKLAKIVFNRFCTGINVREKYRELSKKINIVSLATTGKILFKPTTN